MRVSMPGLFRGTETDTVFIFNTFGKRGKSLHMKNICQLVHLSGLVAVIADREIAWFGQAVTVIK